MNLRAGYTAAPATPAVRVGVRQASCQSPLADTHRSRSASRGRTVRLLRPASEVRDRAERLFAYVWENSDRRTLCSAASRIECGTQNLGFTTDRPVHSAKGESRMAETLSQTLVHHLN